MAIAVQERRAYYPPRRAGSNGEGEAIPSFTVMMHFKWDVPVIYHWKLIAGERALWALLVMPADWLEKRACGGCQAGFLLMDRRRGQRGLKRRDHPEKALPVT